MASRVYVRAPNHLGDGVMAMPAIAALTEVFDEVVVAAPRWGPELYRELGVEVTPRGEVPRRADAAALLAPSFRAAWEARALPRRVGVSWDMRRPLLTTVVERPEGHRALEYAAVVAALGARATGEPRFTPRPEEREAADEPWGHAALAPVSPSGEAVTWPGFAALAARLEGPVRAYVGPGEAWQGPAPTRVGQPLGQLAACLERARVLVVNDSGLSHFGRAVGVPTVVVHGSTTPGRTGAAGSVPVLGPPLSCQPCYKKRCAVGGAPCLDIPVEVVLSAVAAAERPCPPS